MFFLLSFLPLLSETEGMDLVFSRLIALYMPAISFPIAARRKRVCEFIYRLGLPPALVWGVLTTSFFGITSSTDNPVRKISSMNGWSKKKQPTSFNTKMKVYKEWAKKISPGERCQRSQGISNKTASSINAWQKRNTSFIYIFSDNILLN